MSESTSSNAPRRRSARAGQSPILSSGKELSNAPFPWVFTLAICCTVYIVFVTIIAFDRRADPFHLAMQIVPHAHLYYLVFTPGLTSGRLGGDVQHMQQRVEFGYTGSNITTAQCLYTHRQDVAFAARWLCSSINLASNETIYQAKVDCDQTSEGVVLDTCVLTFTVLPTHIIEHGVGIVISQNNWIRVIDAAFTTIVADLETLSMYICCAVGGVLFGYTGLILAKKFRLAWDYVHAKIDQTREMVELAETENCTRQKRWEFLQNQIQTLANSPLSAENTKALEETEHELELLLRQSELADDPRSPPKITLDLIVDDLREWLRVRACWLLDKKSKPQSSPLADSVHKPATELNSVLNPEQ